MKMELQPLPGFDWSAVNWGRPDSPRSVLCSYCSAVLSEEDVPLIVWDKRHFTAQFCDACQAKWWGMS